MLTELTKTPTVAISVTDFLRTVIKAGATEYREGTVSGVAGVTVPAEAAAAAGPVVATAAVVVNIASNLVYAAGYTMPAKKAPMTPAVTKRTQSNDGGDSAEDGGMEEG
jgi:hypothetical protein